MNVRTVDHEPPAATASAESEQIGQNIAAVHDFYLREDVKRSGSQRLAEQIGGFVGRLAFLIVTVVFVIVWIGTNLLLPVWGFPAFDPPPLHWLQGLVALAAVLVTTVVLIKQNRVARLGEQRAQLDLKVMLLIEQKTAKLIDLIEELRRDLPNVKNRHDAGAAVMQRAMDPDRVLAALDIQVPTGDAAIAVATEVSRTPAPTMDHTTSR